MSRLSGHAADYLELRRALGFKLEKEGRLLPDFAAFAEAAGAGAPGASYPATTGRAGTLSRSCQAGTIIR